MYADRLLTLAPREDRLVASAVNQSGSAWTGDLVLTRRSVDGQVLARAVVPVEVAPATVTPVEVRADVAALGDPARELVTAELPGAERTLWFGAEDRDLDLPAPRVTVTTQPTGEGLAVTLTAGSLLRDLLLQADRAHPGASADRGFLTLLPGESATVHVRCPAPLEARSLGEPPVLWTLNEVLRDLRAAAAAR